MKNIIEEKYTFYRLCHIDFTEAINSLKMLSKYEHPYIKFVLLRDIIISYARPYSKTKGVFTPEHRLKAKGLVPRQLKSLHQTLLGLRNKIIAHTDLIARNPQVVNWSSDVQKYFPMSFKNYTNEYNDLIKNSHKLDVLI